MKPLTLTQGLNFVALFALCLTTVFFPFMALPNWQGWNKILEWRAFSIQGMVGNHALIDLLVICAVWYFVFKAKKEEVFESKKLGVGGLVLVGLLPAAFHELLFYVPYVATYGFTWKIFYYQDIWLYASIAILVLYWKIHSFDFKDFLFLYAVISMYFFWWIAGFPITLSFDGPTQYFNNPYVDAIELGSWIFVYAVWFTGEVLSRSRTRKRTTGTRILSGRQPTS